MKESATRAFTIIELLVVVSIIALLVGILLPAIGKARDQAKLTMSQGNLRNLGAAHQTYASEWGDRQFTMIIDSIASYGSSATPAINAYNDSNGGGGAEVREKNHPPVYLGWGYGGDPPAYGMWRYPMYNGWLGNFGLIQPIVFTGNNGNAYFGAFRFVNARQFTTYVSGKFYDKTFYAPKDTVVMDSISSCLDDPGEWCDTADINETNGDTPAWSSYCTSPAGMFNPVVMRHRSADQPNGGGWKDPWSINAGFRSPSFSQALYPNLKTHVLEHNWLQNKQADCNPGFDPGTYGNPGCEPYYFNHSWESTPVCLFYDGHIENIGVRETTRADGRMRTQTDNPEWGLWSKDTPFGEDGYLSEYAYDQATTSFHILTTDGIRGRDIMDG